MENSKNLYQRIVDIMSEVETVYKDTTVSTGKDSYAAVSHDAISKLLHIPMVKHRVLAFPSLVEHTLNIIDVPNKYDGTLRKLYCSQAKAKVTFINADKPDERFDVFSEGLGLDYGDKSIGKAFSYAVKYAFLKTFMLESADNEEERIETHNTNFLKKGHAVGASSQKPSNAVLPNKFPIYGVCSHCNSYLHKSPKSGVIYCANFKKCEFERFTDDTLEPLPEGFNTSNKLDVIKHFENIKGNKTIKTGE